MFSLLLAAQLAFAESDARIAYDTAKELVESHMPRESGSIGSRRAAMYILDKVSALGADVRLDAFSAKTPKGVRQFTNVECSIVSNPSNKWLVLVSHFDTKSGIDCPGANDGASTVGILAALAARLSANKPKNVNVLFAWVDGEECFNFYSESDGLWGSRHLAAKLKEQGARVRAVINVDMLGDKDLKVMIPANTHDGFRRGVLKLAAQKKVADRVVAIDDIVTDDHVPFMEAGFKAINLIDFEYGSKPGKNDYWHTPEDTMDKISIESLKFSGELLAWIIERLS